MGRADAGFALVEMLVAFTIGAMALAAFFQFFSGNIDSMTRTGRKEHALLLAQSRLDAVGADIPAMPGRTAGESAGGFDWQVDIAPFAAMPEVPDRTRISLYQVTATVMWREGGARKATVLHSLRPSGGPHSP